LTIFIPALPLTYALSYYYQDYVPNLPGTSVPLLSIQNSDAAAHLAGAAVFALISFRRATKFWVVLWLASAIMVVATSRGSLLALVVPIVFACLFLGKVRQLASVIIAGALILGTAYIGEMTFTGYQEPTKSQDRRPTPSQISENLVGIIKSNEQGDDTKRWRLDWWDLIIRDTFFGDNFWTGRGFGLNLSVADGVPATESEDLGLPPLRSPHNVHMTILARAGVPGLILWTLLVVSWLGLVVNAMLTARRRRQKQWAYLFLFIACYFSAMLITASFDVVLERPMLGIWFWSLFGFGLGSVMIYRYQNAKSWQGHPST
jgi:O-antigen ligase